MMIKRTFTYHRAMVPRDIFVVRRGIGLIVLSAAVFFGSLPTFTFAADRSPAAPDQPASIFRKQNLVAWCIVPFDAKKRGPEQRAQMLKRLGIQRVAYDWRFQNVQEFEAEILAYKKHGLEYFAFWSWHPAMGPLIRKHQIHPQIWITNPSPKADTQQAKIETAAKQLLPLVKQAGELNCKLGLYNHGGWGGEPANLIAVCKHLRKHHAANHVGIVYNFHHGHGHIRNFATSIKQLKPFLFCVNLNGMNEEAKPKILPIGKGKHEANMMRTLKETGYVGAVGILDHVNSEDSEVQLNRNLTGMSKVLESIGDQAALKSYK